MNGYEMTDDILMQMEYEMREFATCCHICGLADIGTQARLEADGWYLGKVETCPKCLARINKYVGEPKTNGSRVGGDESQAEKEIQRNGNPKLRSLRI